MEESYKLGKGIRRIRRKKNISQNELCNKIEMDQSYLSQIENGKIEPSIKFLTRISDYFNIPLVVFLWECIEEEDFPDNKKETFRYLKPSIDNKFKELFL